jgi:hypothetical protein
MFNKRYYFYSKSDTSKEPIAHCSEPGRLKAACYFAQIKQMTLKQFLSVFAISR